MTKIIAGMTVLALGAGCSFFDGNGTGDYDLHTKTLSHIEERTTPAGAPMRFVENGRLNFCLVGNGDHLSRAVILDAFEKCCGAKPEFFFAGDRKTEAKVKGYKYVLSLGDNEIARANGVTQESIPDQGLVVKTFPGGVIVCGFDGIKKESAKTDKLAHYVRSAGTYYAALDFVERILGVRYYFPGERGTLYPPRKDLTIRPMHYTDEPWFNTRGNNYGFFCTMRSPADRKHWARYCGDSITNGQVRGLDIPRVWRLGGTLPLLGKHGPDPTPIIKANPDRVKDLFYLGPDGKLWANPKGHIGNYYDPVRLENGFADFVVDAWGKYWKSDGDKKYDFDGSCRNLVHRDYVNFGVCDTLLQPHDILENPVVKELNLISDEDKAFVKEVKDERALMRNVYGRFYQYIGNKMQKEMPGATLFVLAYYNSKWAPSDPRWKLPKNVDAIVCDGMLSSYILNEDVRKTSNKLFKGWKDAFGGDHAPGMAYLYGAGNKYIAAIAPEYMGLVPQVLGDNLGRIGIFFDSDVSWHLFYSYYLAMRAQWDPYIDVDAVLDQIWHEFIGGKPGRCLERFHAVLLDVTRNFAMQMKKVPLAKMDEMQAILDEGLAACEKGTDRYYRYKLVMDWWPEAFELARTIEAYRAPEHQAANAAGEKMTIDGRPDEAVWKKSPVIDKFVDISTGKPAKYPSTLRLAWDGKGVYGYFEAPEKPFVNPERDVWGNDCVEIVFSQGLAKEVWYHYAVDAQNKSYRAKKRVLPIPQPIETDSYPAKEFQYQALVSDGKWSVEFFCPYSLFDDRTPPKAGDKWNFNFVKTVHPALQAADLSGTSFTMHFNHNLKMFGTLEFLK